MAPATPGIHHATAIAGDPDENVAFFPWTGDGRPGAFGVGQTRTVAYRTPEESIDFWAERLVTKGIDYERTERNCPALTGRRSIVTENGR